MAFPFNGDLVPTSSGFANLGVGVDSNGQNAFDITSLRPFNHICQVSGIFLDPVQGQSGVMRFSLEQLAFQVSVDGGETFSNLSAGAVDSIGVIGDTNLTGNVDLASAAASGFLSIFDTAGASPIQFAIDQLGLSGLWDFPVQGFNGRVVNALTDSNGTEVQGVVAVIGVSGLLVDIVGQTATISPGNALPRCFAETYSATPGATINHNLGSLNVLAQFYDDSSPREQLLPDRIAIVDANNVSVRFNTDQDGLAVITVCD